MTVGEIASHHLVCTFFLAGNSGCTKRVGLVRHQARALQSAIPYFSVFFFFFPAGSKGKPPFCAFACKKVKEENPKPLLHVQLLSSLFSQEMLQSSPAALPAASNPPPGIVVPAAALPPGNLAMGAGSGSPAVPGRASGEHSRGQLGGLRHPHEPSLPQVEPCTSP